MPITVRTVRGVVVDGSLPINYSPAVQVLHLARGTDGLVRATIVNSRGDAIDLTNCAVTLSIKQFPDDPAPLIARLGDVVAPYTAGIVEFALGANDTILIGEGIFVYDVVLVFGDAIRAQVVPTSNFVVDPSSASPTVLPTIPVPPLDAGKFLSNDGTNLLWGTPGVTGGVPTLLASGALSTQPKLSSGTDGSKGDRIVGDVVGAALLPPGTAHANEKLLVLFSRLDILHLPGTPEAIATGLATPVGYVSAGPDGSVALAALAMFAFIADGPTTADVTVSIEYQVIAWR